MPYACFGLRRGWVRGHITRCRRCVTGGTGGGFDPASDLHQRKVALLHSEMHLLPSALDGVVGVRALGIRLAGSEVDVPLV